MRTWVVLGRCGHRRQQAAAGLRSSCSGRICDETVGQRPVAQIRQGTHAQNFAIICSEHHDSTRKKNRFLSGAHIVLAAHNNADVAPALVMARVEAVSSAKYIAHREAPRHADPIAPVGTNYIPVGCPDIDALRCPPTAPCPVPGLVASPAPGWAKAPVSRAAAPDDAWDPPSVAQPPPPPSAASRPISPAASCPAPLAASRPPQAPTPTAPTKPAEDNRIGPVGTTYTPIKLQAHYSLPPCGLNRSGMWHARESNADVIV